MRIVPIVEGRGEVEAVPVLIRRLALELGRAVIEVGTPIRVPRDKLLKAGELERAVELHCAANAHSATTSRLQRNLRRFRALKSGSALE